MPEDTVTDDEVISQDDIDRLLNASVHDDDDNDDIKEDAASAEDAEDELSELSQDDIDNLLSGGPLGSGSSDNEPDDNDESNIESGTVSEPDDADGLELISQKDIDNLMNGIEADEEPGTSENLPDTDSNDEDEDEDEDEDDDDDLKLFSQEDISKLINNPVVSGEKSETMTGDASLSSDNQTDSGIKTDIDSKTDTDIDTISKSQTDIDNQTDTESQTDTDNQTDTANQADLENETDDTDVLELVSQDDIDKLMNIQPEDDKGIEQEINEGKNEDMLDSEKILSESDAVDIEACMITQETIDQLMKDDMEEDVDAVSDDVSDSEIKPDPEQNFEKDEDIEDENDLDSILKDSPDVVDGESEDGSNLISQDDIDALLQGTEEEDEDILGEVDGNLNDQHIDDDPGTESGDRENQVVIEEVEEVEENEDRQSASTLSIDEVQPGEKEKKIKHGKKWFRSKLMLAGFGTIFLLLSVGAGYYFFFYGPALKAKLHNMKTDLQANSVLKGKTKNMNANSSDFPQVIVPRGPGDIAMKDFIVFSQGKNKKLTYLSVDLSVHYSKAMALDEIKKHLPFYRGVIYDAIEKEFLSDTKKEISEKMLSKVIKQALNQVMIKKYIDQVLLTSFKTG